MDFNYFLQRRQRLQRLLKKQKLPAAILVTNPTNVTYLTGFTGDSTSLLLTAESETLISDSRYTIQLGEECQGIDIAICPPKVARPQFLCDVVNRHKLSDLTVEADHLTKSRFDWIDSQCKTGLVGTVGLTAQLRAIKDKTEIQKIERAIAVCEKAFGVIRAQLTGSQTESQVAHNLEHEIRRFGGTECSFDPIVGVGPRSALPHAVVTDRQIGENPFVLIDWGARVDGYVSDLTRVLITGKISPKMQRIYQVVLKAQLAAIAKIRPGANITDVDSAARKTIGDAGFGKYFGHGLGHGIGLEVHEQPFMSQVGDGQLKSGMVVTVEPGIYLPKIGGVRLEDDVLVTRDGHRVLSSVDKSFDNAFVIIE